MQESFKPGSLPVDAALPELARALHSEGRAILTASPGSGKTTRVPLALAGLLPGLAKPLPGKILMLEPRRLAARAAARYMAALLNEEPGQRVGYRVRLENKVSSASRVELLTEGMFTRRILSDPELSGVSCVIFDEFHERSLQADLGLALCLESIEALRPDLKLLLMSATLESSELSRFLGDCPVIEAKGRAWPIDLRHAPPELTITAASSVEDIAKKTALAVRETLSAEQGCILAFLPGMAEIKRCAALLDRLPPDVDLRPLYGDLSSREQDAAVAPSPVGRRKVVLATDIAQTSLTIEGVRVVVDSGLARAPRFEASTGLSRLVTARVAQDAADQRSGRAGRLEPGLCLRLWPAQEPLFPQSRPEILDADLCQLYLDSLAWGSEPNALPWLSPPPEAALKNAAQSLLALEAASPLADGRLSITAHGQKLARLPLHPRLGHMVLRAAEFEDALSSLAACLAAIVSERDPLRKSATEEIYSDIRLRLQLLRQPQNKRILAAAEQIHRLCGLKSAFKLPPPQAEDYSGILLSLAWPERIAQRRSHGSFRLASGQGAELLPHDPLAAEPWLATASLGGGTNRRIYLAAPVSLEDVLRLHEAKASLENEVYWDEQSEAVVARSTRRLDALILDEKPLPPSPELAGHIKEALLQGIVAAGLGCLPWNDEARQLQARVQMLRGLEQEQNTWPDLGDEALIAALSGEAEATWLSPWLTGLSRRSQLSSIDLGAALGALLPWPLPDRLENEAPKRLSLPSGSSAKIDYLPVLRGEAPVLAVKLQEMFGQLDSPKLAGGRVSVMLHLLSPAGRPLQLTGDLRHFWSGSYKQVRAEMRGRYPRHPWPEDPLSAAPTGKTKKRLDAELKR